MTDLRHPFTAHQPDGRNASATEVLGKSGRSDPGTILEIPARQGRAVRVSKGQHLRVINTHGSQVGDFWAFSEADPGEHLSMEHMRPDLRKLTPQPGDAMVTNRRRAILTLLEDTSPGVHDTLIASCDIHRYHKLGHQGYHDNCTDNLRMALSAIGILLPEIPCPLNLWMNTPPRESGDILWLPPVSRPGDQVTFRAEMDLIAVISACPMDLLPINGEDSIIRSLSVSILA
ncbi:DUF1989 domain-containing protein [Neotabrizicola sp. sgz301269]|uniref:DUF1989 domain-containing protein n=1 Tax=Neotabrizicola sp. sgz301269 TaxID=3276282 RepID=UPI00376F54F2